MERRDDELSIDQMLNLCPGIEDSGCADGGVHQVVPKLGNDETTARERALSLDRRRYKIT